MGHKLSTALIILNAMGILACIILIAAANKHAPEVAIQFIREIQPSIRMFIVGVGLPLVAWEIAESEFIDLMTSLNCLDPGRSSF